MITAILIITVLNTIMLFALFGKIIDVNKSLSKAFDEVLKKVPDWPITPRTNKNKLN